MVSFTKKGKDIEKFRIRLVADLKKLNSKELPILDEEREIIRLLKKYETSNIEHHVFRKTKWRIEDNWRDVKLPGRPKRTEGIPENYYANIIANFYNLIGRLHQSIHHQGYSVSHWHWEIMVSVRDQIISLEKIPLFTVKELVKLKKANLEASDIYNRLSEKIKQIEKKLERLIRFLSLCFRFKVKQNKIPQKIYIRLNEIFAYIEAKNKLIQKLKDLEISEEKFIARFEEAISLDRGVERTFRKVYE